MKVPLTVERLKELLEYNLDTGVFTWKVPRGRGMGAGSIAGSSNKYNYRQIGVDGKLYLAHRLAWLYVHGKWPDNGLDHINGDNQDNRISNLRDVDHVVNSQNQRKASRNSSSGLLGAFKKDSHWISQIQVNGKIVRLGTFLTPEEAHQAYLKAKRELHPGCTI